MSVIRVYLMGSGSLSAGDCDSWMAGVYLVLLLTTCVCSGTSGKICLPFLTLATYVWRPGMGPVCF